MEDRTDKINPTGIFELRMYDDCGKLLETYIDNNLIVNGGRDAIVDLIGSGDADKVVNTISFGTNGAAPVLTDTTITGAFDKAVNAVAYPATGQVRFDWSLELVENNGVTIREYGLKCDDGTLFARKTRADIAKNNTVRLEGTWTIIF
jgi:hypothetical protein